MNSYEWDEWKRHPVTQEFLDYLARLRERVKEEWAGSAYTGALDSETIQRNAAAIGQVELLKALMDTEYADIEDTKGE